MIKYVIARGFIGGLCYLVMPTMPFFPPSWVPEFEYATQFDDESVAIAIASQIPGAMIEPIENDDSE